MIYQLHDAAIVSIGIQDENLVVSIVLVDNTQVRMTFIEPDSWSLSPFEVQNIILDFYEYDQTTLDDKIAAFFEVSAYDRGLVLEDGYSMYCYTASAGVEGYIIAKALRVEQLGASPILIN